MSPITTFRQAGPVVAERTLYGSAKLESFSFLCTWRRTLNQFSKPCGTKNHTINNVQNNTVFKLIVVAFWVGISKFLFEIYCVPFGGNVDNFLSRYTALLPRSQFSVF